MGHSYDANGKCACGVVELADRIIYFTNSANWSTVNYYSWYTPENIISAAWPGSAMTKVEGKIYSCTVPVDAPNIIFNDGSTQTADLTVPADKNMYDFATGKWSTYPTEPEPEPDPTVPDTQETQPDSTTDDPSQPSSVSPIVWVVIAVAVIAAAAVAVILIKRKQ